MDRALALRGQRIALTGRLASMPRAEVEERLRGAGATVCTAVDADTDVLVVGLGGWPLASDGQPTRALRDAERLESEGRGGPRIVDERQLLTSLGLAGPELAAQYTTDQLARILDVPPAQLRAWVRAGLIRPTRVVRRMWTFDFRDVASARSLHRLMREGAKPAALARGLEQLERWLPDARRSLGQLATLEQRGDLLVRTRSGQLAEPNGQLRLFAPVGNDLRALPREDEDGDTTASPDAGESTRIVGTIRPDSQSSEAPPSAVTPIAAGDGSIDAPTSDDTEPATTDGGPDLLDAGLALERAGRPAEAATVYRTALETTPDRPELWFNLGNVLYGLVRVGEAAQALETAVRLAPGFVEAWNNLGNAYAESGRSEQAIGAWRRAVALDPGCADAHFNLAQELDAIEELVDARRHAVACLELLPADAPEAFAMRRLVDHPPGAPGWGGLQS